VVKRIWGEPLERYRQLSNSERTFGAVQPFHPGSFVLFRRPVAQGRMKSLPVINDLDESSNPLARFFQTLLFESIHCFVLECLHEALGIRVVVGIAYPAHARLDAALFEPVDVVG
jgi:hypothetical protein